ncbi:wall-associated receptor kinase-like 8 [Carya illinoinensis]|uniref:wall-associated receptor kinase-like 8 n=1 Tax=Carya illinoinensis TaxID=32201 RepID=UPI001C7285F3|nr:wall-associated receptor kinase-like 8 [Carya illinoinensis]
MWLRGRQPIIMKGSVSLAGTQRQLSALKYLKIIVERNLDYGIANGTVSDACLSDVLNQCIRASINVINSSCPEDCGNVSIPYTFGIGKGCYVGNWYEIVCRSSNHDSYNLGFPMPYLKRLDLEVLEIDITSLGEISINYPIFSSCTNGKNNKKNLELEKSPFVFAVTYNTFVAIGCNNSASMWSIFPDDSISFGGCNSPCDRAPFTKGSHCNATNCCQATTPSNLQAFSTTIETKSSYNNGSSECNYAFLVDQNWFETNFTEPNLNVSVPVRLYWELDNTTFHSLPTMKNMTTREYKNSTYRCYQWMGSGNTTTYNCGCKSGYRGNSYLLGGCGDINECADPDFNITCTPDTRCENTEGFYRCVAVKNTKLFMIIGMSSFSLYIYIYINCMYMTFPFGFLQIL